MNSSNAKDDKQGEYDIAKKWLDSINWNDVKLGKGCTWRSFGPRISIEKNEDIKQHE